MANNESRKAIAYRTLSNFGGIEIYECDSDSVTYRYYDNDIETAEIQYTMPEDEREDCRAYFKCGEMEIYLDECMRI